MTSILTLKAPSSPDAPPWSLEAHPSAYSEAGRIQFNAMPGIRWVKDSSASNGRGFYRGPAEAVRMVAATLSKADVVRVRFAESHELPQLAPDCGAWEHDSRLRYYQNAGVEWVINSLASSGAALLADEMGLGKTPMTIVAAESFLAQDSIVVVVAPKVMKRQWQDEIARWGTRTDLSWHIMGAEEFRIAHAKHRLPFDSAELLVLDEAHYYSNPKAARSKAVAAFRSLARFTIALTGTPIGSRTRNLHNILDICWPTRFGSKWQFESRYCNGRFVEVPHVQRPVWQAEGTSHVEELAERLKACMLRRTKSEVALELPPLVRTIHSIELPTKARASLQKAAHSEFATASEGASLLRLLSRIEAHKIDWAVELAEEILSADGRPLIFTTRIDTAKEIAKRLNAACATGEDAAEERAAILSSRPAGVATIYSVTTGINLTMFDSVIFVGLDYDPSKLLQAEARPHRIGQRETVNVHYGIAEGTADEVIRERVIERLENFSALIGGDVEKRLAEELAGSEEDLINAIIGRF